MNVNSFTNCVNIIRNYVLGLIFTTGKKTCTALAQTINLKHDKLYRWLANHELFKEFNICKSLELVKHYHEIKPGWLIIDDTKITKKYSQKNGRCF